jgi:hypothetical protein
MSAWSKDCCRRGSALIELLGVVMFAFLIIMTVVEFHRIHKYQIALSGLARDAAIAARRACVSQSGAALNTCLEQKVFTPVDQLGQATIPGFAALDERTGQRRGRVLISVHRMSSGAMESVRYPTAQTPAVDPALFPDLQEFAAARGSLVIVEASFRYRPVTPIGSLLTVMRRGDDANGTFLDDLVLHETLAV